MKQSKTVYLVFALIGIVIIIMLVQVFKFSQPSTPAPAKSTPLPITQYTPAPEFHIVSATVTDQPIFVTDTITLTFDRPANNEKFVFEITPEEKVLALFNPDLTKITFTPFNAWDFDTQYSIKVLKSTQAKDNQFLDQNYEFSFQTKPFIGI